jgi:hypothetical protein
MAVLASWRLLLVVDVDVELLHRRVAENERIANDDDGVTTKAFVVVDVTARRRDAASESLTMVKIYIGFETYET